MKNRIIIPLGFLILISVLLYSYEQVSTNQSQQGEGEATIVAIRTVDDADATLIFQGDQAMLIDTGEDVDANHIIQVMNDNGVRSLSCMIISHYDKDHIGGAITILHSMPVERIIMPYYDENRDVILLKEYTDKNNIVIQYPTHNTRFMLGDMSVTIYPPLESNYKKDNNYSLAALVSYGEVDMLFTGDALRKRSEELMLNNYPSIELLKLPHHGRSNSASIKLLSYISPEYILVNSLSMDEDIEAKVEELGAKAFYTRLEDYYFNCDGAKLWLQEQR